MNWLKPFIENWAFLFVLHGIETSAFILLVWVISQSIKLPVNTQYLLWLLALLKIFIPPFFHVPAHFATSIQYSVTPVILPVISNTNVPSHPVNPFALGLFTAWILSVLIISSLVVWQNIQIKLRLRKANPVNPKDMNPKFNGTKITNLFILQSIGSPFVIGVRNPRVYLPENWNQLKPSQQQAILAHEIAHINSHDRWILILQILAIIIFGMNPLVWIVYFKINQLRELRCDEFAIQNSGIAPIDYARLIFAFIERGNIQSYRALYGNCFSKRNKNLFTRINFLLNKKEMNMNKKHLKFYVIPILVGIAILPLSWKCNQNTMEPPALSTREAPSGEPEFVPYDSPPKPTGGFKAIQSNLKYPEKAKNAGVEGSVILHVLIDEQGQVVDVRILKSIDDGKYGLNEAAIQAVKSAKWQPAKLKGKPVKVWVSIPVLFSLNKNKFTSEAPLPPPPPSGYDNLPEPIGGFQAIQQNLHYPEKARSAGIQDRVILHVLIDENGQTTKINVLKKSKYTDMGFEEAAMEVLKKVQWNPAHKNGKPVKMWVAIPVVFRLNN
ncbi:MAG: M56 family peptidase [Calditrichaeota bacterium]|nr:MAG: M56 family peptidase [Calditrichota bacterium]